MPPQVRTIADDMVAEGARVALGKREEEDKGNAFGRGLGFLINNPVTRVAMQPLDWLDRPRRLVTLGVEEALEGFGLEANPEDTRSNWEKFNDPEYGFGQIVPEVSFDDSLGNFFNRGIGLAGDIALDPLTYVAGLGIATKAGTPLSKGIRAGMARAMLDVGLDAPKVERFVRRGASVLDETDRLLLAGTKADIGEAGLRMGTRKHNVLIPGTERLGLAASRGLGTTSDVLRRTRAGETLAKIRTPERVEDAYQRLFHSKGPVKSFGTAAERVAMENTWRNAQGAFQGVFDRDRRVLRQMSRRLDDTQKRSVLDAIEHGTIDTLEDASARQVAEFMSERFAAMLDTAQEKGLKFARRERYTPHILTRDAVKWMKTGGDEAAAGRAVTGLIKENLFEPSGVTMGRRFQGGQVLELNGHEIRLSNAPTINEINEKFRTAGLDFDFFETDPSVILQKYTNMLSSDVGEARAYLSRIGMGGDVSRLTPRQMEMIGYDVGETAATAAPTSPAEAIALGMEDATRGTAENLQPPQHVIRTEQVLDAEGRPTGQFQRIQGREVNQASDLAAAARAYGEVELPEDLFQVALAPKREIIKMGKDGKPLLSKSGKAKNAANRTAEAEGRAIQPLTRDDFIWTKPKESPTRAWNTEQRKVLAQRHAALENEFGDLTQTIERKLEGARSGATEAYHEVIKGHQARVRRLTDELKRADFQGEMRTLRADELNRWIDQLDGFVNKTEKDLRSLDRRLARNTQAAYDDAVRIEMEALRSEADQLRSRLGDIHEMLGPETERASYHQARANQLHEAIYGPTREVMEAAGGARERIASEFGIDRLLADQSELRTRIRDIEAGREVGDLAEEIENLRWVDLQLNTVRGVPSPPTRQQTALIERSNALRQTIAESQAPIREVKRIEAELARAVEEARQPLRKVGDGYVFTPEPGVQYLMVKRPEGGWLLLGPDRQPIQTGLTSIKKAEDAADLHYMQQRAAQLAGENERMASEGARRWTSTVKRNAKQRREAAQTRVRTLRAQLPEARKQAKTAERARVKAQRELEGVLGDLRQVTPPAPRDVMAPPAAMEQRALEQQAVREQLPAQALEEPGARPQAPNVRSRTDLSGIPKSGNISESGRQIPIVPDEALPAVERQLDAANATVQRVEQRVNALKATIASDTKVSLRRRAVKIAKRKGGTGSPRHLRAQAMLQREMRDAAERHGLAEAERELKRVTAIRDQISSSLRTEVVTGYTPEEAARIRAAIEAGNVPSAVEELQRRRMQARGEAAALEREAGRIPPRVEDLQEQMAQIVRDPEYRGELRTFAAEQEHAATLAAQGGQREAIAATQAEFPGRRAEFTEELEDIARREETRVAERPEIVRERGTARGQQTRAQKKAWRMNLAMRPDGGLPTPKVGANEGWQESARARLAEMDAVMRDNTLDPEVREALRSQTEDVLSLLDEVHDKDLSTQGYKHLAEDARSGKLGRMIEVMLNDDYERAAPALIGDDVVMTKDLRRSFERLRDATYKREFIPVLDTFTNLFKTYATATPGFHVRNAISAVFTNSADGVSLREQAEAARLFRQFRKAKDGPAWLAAQEPEIRQAFEAAFGSGIGGRYTEPGVGQRGSLRHRATEKAFDNRYLQWLGEKPGANVEGIARLAPALQTMRRGGSVEDALARITRTHFDYSQMSRFDRQARRVIPFWTFMSRNLPLQIQMMYLQPRRYQQFNSVIRNLRGEDVEGTPPYMKALGAFPLGNTTLGNLPLLAQPDLPHVRLQEDLKRYEKALSLEDPLQAFSDVNPLATTPLEVLFKKDIFTGREYKDTDVRTAGPLEFPIAALGEILHLGKDTPGGQRAYPELLFNAVSSLIPLYDRSARLAPNAVTGGANQDYQARQLESWLRFLGVPIRTLSPQQQRATRLSERYERLDEQAMQRALAELDQAS